MLKMHESKSFSLKTHAAAHLTEETTLKTPRSAGIAPHPIRRVRFLCSTSPPGPSRSLCSA